MATIYKGKVAHTVCDAILAANEQGGPYNAPINGFDHLSVGYWKDGDKWIAYDNTTEDCWIEEFDTRKDAVEYCNI